MATILKFRLSNRPQESSSSEQTHRQLAAEIVIFPGVRYERWKDEDGSIEVSHETDHTVYEIARAFE